MGKLRFTYLDHLTNINRATILNDWMNETAMNKSDSDLLKLAYTDAPCNVDWNSMEGDDRTRFCGQCNLNVYNVAALSDKETVKLMRGAQESQERLCLLLYRRPDGTLVTDNCPVGLKKIRDRVRLRAAMMLALLVSIGLIGEVQAQGIVGAPVDPGRWNGSIADTAAISPTATSDFKVLTGITLSAAVIWIAANRRASFTILGLGLIVLLFLAGVSTGLCNDHHAWCTF